MQIGKTSANSDQTAVLAETKTSATNSATAKSNNTPTETTSNKNIISTTNNSSNGTLESQSQKSSEVKVRSKRAVAPLNLVRELIQNIKMNVDVASNGSSTHIINPNDPRKVRFIMIVLISRLAMALLEMLNTIGLIISKKSRIIRKIHVNT